MSAFLKVLRKGNASKHQKLLEEWGQNKEPVLEGITFYVKYLGSCLVENLNTEQIIADAIKNIIAMAKSSGRKLERVAVAVSPRSIKVTDIITQEIHLEIPINRISYCSADSYYDHVFAFIRSNANDIMECHAFLCAKKKMAQAITLTISQAFNIAYEIWQSTQEDQDEQNNHSLQVQRTNEIHSKSVDCDKTGVNSTDHAVTEGEQLLLIDLTSDTASANTSWGFQNDILWKSCFEEFSSNQSCSVLDTNLKPDSIADISQFVVDQKNIEPNKEFFQSDSDLLQF